MFRKSYATCSFAEVICRPIGQAVTFSLARIFFCIERQQSTPFKGVAEKEGDEKSLGETVVYRRWWKLELSLAHGARYVRLILGRDRFSKIERVFAHDRFCFHTSKCRDHVIS